MLNLPDPSRPGSLFIERLSRDYGFISSHVSALNPNGLPVGFAIDKRPLHYGDRAYLGITCAACHTRQLTFPRTLNGRDTAVWEIPVHGGPSLVDLPRFKQDLYDAFFALLVDDGLVIRFGLGLLGHAPSADEIKSLRGEIKEFTGPVALGRSLTIQWQIKPADFGPGNLNALTQGNYNNVGLGAWLGLKGLSSPGSAAPLRPGFEGAVNYPPMWFAHGDTWAQWFAEIHHPGARNWVQSVSSSEVRPPKMIESQKAAVVLGSIHFENIAEIQHSLELLRTPKWPAQVFGTLDPLQVEKGRVLYQQQCAGCHTRRTLAPNDLGIVFHDRTAFDVGTDPTASVQFAEGGQRRVDDLKALAEKILTMRRAQLQPQGDDMAAHYMKLYSRGRPDDFAIAKDLYANTGSASSIRSGAAYWTPPLEGIFATSPYLHNGSIRTLKDLLTAPTQRPKSFHTGSTEFDASAVGLKNDGPFLYDTQDPGKGNGGHAFGTELDIGEKAALIEYLKSL